jgi:hypothetical protein
LNARAEGAKIIKSTASIIKAAGAPRTLLGATFRFSRDSSFKTLEKSLQTAETEF